MRIRPQDEWEDPDGAIWTVEGGATTREVMEVEAWHSYKFDQNRDMGLSDSTEMAKWCAEYVVEIEDDERTLRVNTWETVDRRLPVPALLELKEKIVELSMYDPDVVEKMYEYWKVALDGGCPCPICKGHVERSEAAPFVRERCKVPNYDEHILHIARLYSGLQDEEILDEPWWLYQLQSAYKRAKADIMEEEEEEQEKTEQAHQLTKQRGIA